MSEEIINCNFYNDKICNLFTEYFKFKIECKNLSLCAVEDDIEKECPYKQLRELSKEERQLREGWHAQCEVIEALREKNEELKNNIELMSKYNSENFAELLKFRKAIEEIKEILFPKNKWIITDCEEILEIQKITNEALK